jgi:hypothetical protein
MVDSVVEKVAEYKNYSKDIALVSGDVMMMYKGSIDETFPDGDMRAPKQRNLHCDSYV